MNRVVHTVERLGIGHLAELHVGQNLVDIRGLHLLSPNALDLAMDANRNVAILLVSC